MDGKKEYVIKINGTEEGISSVDKLRDRIVGLGNDIERVNDTAIKTAKASGTRKAAISDEEKAAKKLADTQKKIAEVNSEANRAQIEATQALRERTREVTQQIQIEKAGANSIEGMRIRLSQLKDEWKKMDTDSDAFKRMSADIKELNDRIAEAERSTGDFRRNVGNYESALSGLDKLSLGINNVSKMSMGMAQSLMGSLALMQLFGDESEENAQKTQQLQKVIALLSIALQVNENLIKTGISLKAEDTAATQAATAATQASTVATTASSKALGVLKKALVATGIGAIVVLLGTLVANFDKVKKVVYELIPGLEDFGESWDAVKTVLAGVGNAVIKWIITPFKAVSTFVGKLLKGDIKGAFTESWAEVKNGYNVIGNYQKGAQAQMLRNQENAAKEQAKLSAKTLEEEIKTNEARLGSDWKYTEEARETYQKLFDAKKKLYAEDSKEYKELIDEEYGYNREFNARAKALADQRRADELSAVRAAEDARIKLIEDGNEQTRQAIETSYDRQIEDLRNRLATEEGLTVTARAALNDQIESLEQQKERDLEKLRQEQADEALQQEQARADAALALQQEVEASRRALIVDSYARQTAEINAQYKRQIDEYKKRLDDEENQTAESQARITELIMNAEKARDSALAKLTNDQLGKRAEQQLSSVENALKRAMESIGETVVRDEKGLNLIDVDATRQNLADTNAALDEYINGLGGYLENYRTVSDAVLAALQVGTPEYEAELQKRASVEEDVAKKIAGAQKQQADNTKLSAEIQIEAVRDMFSKISDIATQASDVIGQVMSMVNEGLSEQVEALNAQIDAVNEKYEAAQKQREEAAANVEDIEQRMQEASGGTAEALKEQLQDAMRARNEAAREEQRLAREKERLEAQAAKKEKQMKRNELVSNIAVGVANVAQAVTKALTAGPIVGQVLAGIVAALGAVEIGTMTRQLAKLEHGGEIKGPSHANGGVPIKVNGQYTYEAQGGEFMVNDKSYSANKPLVNFINSTQRAITLSDLAGIVPVDAAPAGVTDVARLGEDRIVDAINGIDFQPVVAVTDILDKSDQVVTVRDMAGA